MRKGIPADQEKLYRIFGCELIQECVILLDMAQLCGITAQTIYQRFYYRRSFTAFDAHIVAMACIFLAGKIEETPKTMRDIINVMYHCQCRRNYLLQQQNEEEKKRSLSTASLTSSSTNLTSTEISVTPSSIPVFPSLIVGGDVYITWKLQLIRTERFILKELGFNIYTFVNEQPHKYILYYLRTLGGTNELAQCAWNYLNDSLRLPLTVRYTAETIACSVVYLASRMVQFPLPRSVPWYTVFNTKYQDILDISNDILSLYTYPRMYWLPSLLQTTASLTGNDSSSLAASVDEDTSIIPVEGESLSSV